MDGGFFQIGGYNKELLLEDPIWIQMRSNKHRYEFDIHGISISGNFISGSDEWNTGFIDSGTTFTYFPPKMWD